MVKGGLHRLPQRLSQTPNTTVIRTVPASTAYSKVSKDSPHSRAIVLRTGKYEGSAATLMLAAAVAATLAAVVLLVRCSRPTTVVGKGSHQ